MTAGNDVVDLSKLNGTGFSVNIGDATTLDVSKFTQGVKIDATANADNITGSNKADTINGGAGNDTIQGNQGDDVLTGGNGADTFIIGNAKDFGVDQILDFSAEDKISMAITSTMPSFTPGELKKFDASTFSTVTYKTLDSVLATFGSGGANATGSGDVVIFSYDGKTYALLANGPFTETGSALVDITGANVASLTESNFGDAIDPTPVPPAPPAPPVVQYSNYAEFVNAVAFGTIPAGKLAEILTLEGQEAGLLAVNKTYLDKIAAGGIKNVTSDIVVTVGTGADNLSNNFDSTEFKTKLAVGALGSNVMNINGSNENDVIVTYLPGGTITGGSGADTITAHATAASIDGGSGADVITANAAATINGGTENDTIYLNAGGSVDGGAGADKIYVSGSGDATITGGSGNDTISLGTGADTVVFAKTNNGDDTITNFTAGSTGNYDKLAVGGATGLLGGNVVADPTLEKAINSTSGVTLTSGKNVIVITDKASLVPGDFAASASQGKIGTSSMSNDNKVFVVAYDDSATEANLYLVTITNAASGTATVAKVGTVDATSGFVAGNFIDVA